MRRKPKGIRYRNLLPRGNTIYYEKVVDEKLIRRSLGVDDWDEAARTGDALERKLGIGTEVLRIECPTFAEAARAVLDEPTTQKETTRDDLAAKLGVEKVEDGKVVKAAGPLVRHFGAMRLDAIRRVHLLDWYSEFIDRGGRKKKTGKNYIDALASVFVWGMERELIDENPVDGLRAVLRRRNRTAAGRAESEAAHKAQPIEKPAEVAALVAATEAMGGKPYLVTLLGLDAGLRLGEATALDWSDVEWDRQVEEDGQIVNRPALRVRRSLSRGKYLGMTKSGRERRVALSRRLRKALREEWLRQGRPESGAVAKLDHANYRNRTLRSLCKKAGVGLTGEDGKWKPYTPHNLRDTYASQLLSAGVQLAYVSHRLGHADVAVTAKHYARWCGDDAYRAPISLREGEVPADLLCRLGSESHQSPTSSATA